MIDFLLWVEHSGFATWLRESTSLVGYTLVLSLHTIGLAFLVGFNAVIGLRILGVARGLPLAPMLKFFPLMVAGFCVNAVTGLVLLTTAPTDFLTNGVFYVKMSAIAVAAVALWRLYREVSANQETLDNADASTSARIWAGTSLACWAVAIVAGRLTAYSWPVVGLPTVRALLVLTIVLLVGGYISRLATSRELPWRQRVWRDRL